MVPVSRKRPRRPRLAGSAPPGDGWSGKPPRRYTSAIAWSSGRWPWSRRPGTVQAGSLAAPGGHTTIAGTWTWRAWATTSAVPARLRTGLPSRIASSTRLRSIRTRPAAMCVASPCPRWGSWGHPLGHPHQTVILGHVLAPVAAW